MLKQQAILEIKKDERVYQLSLDSLSPLGEVYDVLCQMKGYIVQRMLDEQKASEEQIKEQNKVCDGISECKEV